MKIKPLGERVLLKMEKPREERTKSGIYLPKSEDDKKEGIVVEFGNFERKETFSLKIGDKVLYKGYNHEDVEIENEKYVIVELNDIVAKIE